MLSRFRRGHSRYNYGQMVSDLLRHMNSLPDGISIHQCPETGAFRLQAKGLLVMNDNGFSPLKFEHGNEAEFVRAFQQVTGKYPPQMRAA